MINDTTTNSFNKLIFVENSFKLIDLILLINREKLKLNNFF